MAKRQHAIVRDKGPGKSAIQKSLFEGKEVTFRVENIGRIAGVVRELGLDDLDSGNCTICGLFRTGHHDKVYIVFVYCWVTRTGYAIVEDFPAYCSDCGKHEVECQCAPIFAPLLRGEAPRERYKRPAEPSRPMAIDFARLGRNHSAGSPNDDLGCCNDCGMPTMFCTCTKSQADYDKARSKADEELEFVDYDEVCCQKCGELPHHCQCLVQ